VVQGQTAEAVGQVYTLTASVQEPITPYLPITGTIPVTFTIPVTDTSVRTLILYNSARFNALYTGTETITATRMISRLEDLADHPDVEGALVDLNDQPAIAAAYGVWDRQPRNPLAANYVAAHVKSLLYRLAPAYPNLEYLVLAGDDRVIPHRRVRDDALISNERQYRLVTSPELESAMGFRYFLSDEYYSGLLPLPWRGRELYLPQLAVGRLVERPSEIVTAVDAFLDHPTVSPDDALVTGYDFLIDQAQVISHTLVHQGVTVNPLIGDDWTADALRSQMISVTEASDVNSLNAHFTHFALIPATTPVSPTWVGDVFLLAQEVTGTTSYTGSLVASVGCHSGLNVPDEGAPAVEIGRGTGVSDTVTTGDDWPQAFLRQGGVFLGNTGYGYGDSELIAYSERLMANFMDELGYWDPGPPTVGQALLRAKQRYFVSAAAGSLSTYDEKVLGEMTLYGLPMLRVRVPVTTTTPPGAVPSAVTARSTRAPASGPTETPVRFSFDYVSHTVGISSTYYTVVGEDGEVQIAGGRPVEPRVQRDVHVDGLIAHGALWVGGTYRDVPIDPLVSRVLTDDTYIAGEPRYPSQAWYPRRLGVVNRLLSIEGQMRERLVIVPGQFTASTPPATPTVGTQRLYEELDFVIYHAPFTTTDFVAPSIWTPQAISTSLSVRFRALVEDASGEIERVVVLYRELEPGSASGTWSLLELRYDAPSGWASGFIPPVDGEIEYLVQAVDAAGNVGLAMDHGLPFRNMIDGELRFAYLPLATRSYVRAPDLVVRDIVATASDVQVTIANEGNAPMRESFWVDVYIDPDPLPTAVNQIWPYLADEGLVWGVDAVLQPGDTVTLQVGDGAYFAEYSEVYWPLMVGTPVYVQVDSAGEESYGAVLEMDEVRGDYNNIGHTTVSSGSGIVPQFDALRPKSAPHLPPR
jgi:hypothetical protein